MLVDPTRSPPIMVKTLGGPAARERAHPSAFSPLRPLTRLVNGPAVRLAGSSVLPFWALVRHRGRRSGRTYATPAAARPTAEGFAIPLAFGETADWCRNVIAAGGGVVRWSGRDYTVSDPRIVDAERAVAAFHPLQRPFLRLLGIRRVLLVRDAR